METMEPIRPRSNLAKHQSPKMYQATGNSNQPVGVRPCSECRRDFKTNTSSTKFYCPECTIARRERIEALAEKVKREEQAEVEAGRAIYDRDGNVCYR